MILIRYTEDIFLPLLPISTSRLNLVYKCQFASLLMFGLISFHSSSNKQNNLWNLSEMFLLSLSSDGTDNLLHASFSERMGGEKVNFPLHFFFPPKLFAGSACLKDGLHLLPAHP